MFQQNDENIMEIENVQTEQESILVCDGLVKIYKTEDIEVLALQGLELEIKKGELVAIIGKSGSGKSTLLNMIGGLEKPTAGRLYVDGNDLFAMSEKNLVLYRKNLVGFVWQNSGQNLLPYFTSLQNVEAPLYFDKMSQKERREKAMGLLKLIGIDHKADAYPSQMSGGEQQRVSIAVALANEPAILLADEPTGAVDTKTADAISDLFRKLNRELGLTIILVTHDPRMASKTNRTIMISDGKFSKEQVEEEHYHVMDRANRLQLGKDMLEQAGIRGDKVKIVVEDSKIVITK